jgi:hypothetical protein
MWRDQDVALVRKVKKRASAYTHIYESSAGRYADIQNKFTLVISVLTAVFGAGGIIGPAISIISVSINNTSVENNLISSFTIGMNVLVFGIGILSLYVRTMDFIGKSAKHLSAASQFQDLYLSVDSVLRRDPDNRGDFADFFSGCVRKDTQIRLMAGPIPAPVIDGYYNSHKKPIDREELFNEIYEMEMDDADLRDSAKRTHGEIYQMARFVGSSL